jgi:hypothetical protein
LLLEFFGPCLFYLQIGLHAFGGRDQFLPESISDFLFGGQGGLG